MSSTTVSISELEKLEKQAMATLEKCKTSKEFEAHYSNYLGKKGTITSMLKGLKNLEPEDRKKTGQVANQIRSRLEKKHKQSQQELETQSILNQLNKENYDALRPLKSRIGHLHPITKMQMQVESIFSSMGFEIADGPEVETDENNFTRLNFSPDHPAREMQDTIWTKDGNLLRTHTSCVQVRSMQKLKPPFRIIAPGRVFRYEETDASHENTFHQVEGMMIGKDISVANLIHIMKTFLTAIFESDIKVRLRPGYFPFVEPGFELDSSCLICHGKGCKTCKHSGWIELLPCGLVHPEVLKAGGIDPDHWNGFAFGLGLDRLVMLKYNIEDIRHFLSGNLRFLNQF